MKRLTIFVVALTVCTGGLGWAQSVNPIDFSKPYARMNVGIVGGAGGAAAPSQSFTYVNSTTCSDINASPLKCNLVFNGVQEHDLIIVVSTAGEDNSTAFALSISGGGSSTVVDVAVSRHASAGRSLNISYILDIVSGDAGDKTFVSTAPAGPSTMGAVAFHYRPAITAQVDVSPASNTDDAAPLTSSSINTGGTPSLVVCAFGSDFGLTPIDVGTINGGAPDYYVEAGAWNNVGVGVMVDVVASPTNGVTGVATNSRGYTWLQIMSFK